MQPPPGKNREEGDEIDKERGGDKTWMPRPPGGEVDGGSEGPVHHYCLAHPVVADGEDVEVNAPVEVKRRPP
jgi:hypothetical protein